MIAITTYPKTDMDLMVCAELRTWEGSEDLSLLINNITAWLGRQKTGNATRYEYAYKFKQLSTQYAELWHYKPDGTANRRIADVKLKP